MPADAAIAQLQQSDGGRIAAYRRIGAGAQARGRRPTRRAARPGGDDLPFVYFGTLLTQGQGLARVVATGRAHRDRQDRQGAADAGAGTEQHPAGNAASGAHLRGDRAGAMRARYCSLRLHARRLAERIARWNHAGDGESAGRISGRAHGIPGARGVADFATRRADAAAIGDRDAGIHDGAVRGQDRHAHSEPHGGAQALGAGQRVRYARISVGTFPPELHRDRRCWRANESPSIRWRRPTTSSRATRAPVAVEKLDAWTLAHAYPLSPEQLSVAHIWQPQGSDGYVVAAKGAAGGDRGAVCAERRPTRARYTTQVAKMAGDGLARAGGGKRHALAGAR